MKKTFIYIMKCHEYYKIGVATNLRERLSALQIGNPYKIELIESFETNSKYIMAFERDLHTSLYRWSIRGEWFRLSVPQLDVIKDVCRVVEGFSV